MAETKELPPFVRFALLPQEDRSQLLAGGKYAFKDVEVAYITRPGQRDTAVKEAKLWLADLQKRTADGLCPQDWYTHFVASYEAWKSGLELPTTGTPIRGWPLLLPAQIENLLLLGYRSVEDLASTDETGIQRIGIGGARLRDLARDWLATTDQGKATAEREAMRVHNLALTEQVTQLAAQVQELKLRATAATAV